LQEAGIAAKLARTIGIAVDHRRRNRSLESLQVGQTATNAQRPLWVPTMNGVLASSAGPTPSGLLPILARSAFPVAHVLQENANRIKAYKANLVVFPRRSNKPKAGDSSAEELAVVKQLTDKVLLPITAEKHELESIKITSDMKVGPRRDA
jgi:large subunit ribosomal protein L13e